MGGEGVRSMSPNDTRGSKIGPKGETYYLNVNNLDPAPTPFM